MKIMRKKVARLKIMKSGVSQHCYDDNDDDNDNDEERTV